LRKIFFVFLVFLFLLIPVSIFEWLDEPYDPSIQRKARMPIVSVPPEVHISAVGDVMMHLPQIQSGKKADGTYDFRPFFQAVKPKLSQADIAIANFETTLGGKSLPYQGYPRFNSPDEIIPALKDAGFDLLSTANNHSMDTGTEGVIRTYQRIKAYGLHPIGTAPTAKERREVFIEKNGMKLAFLAYTESTNGLPVPKDKPYLVNRINLNQIKQDISAAQKRGAEFVFVSLHFGIEYQREPNAKQIQTARQVLEAGADAVLGSHPHVLQPIQPLTIHGKKKVIIYSMGNFVSNQNKPYTDEGMIVDLQIRKNPKTHQAELHKVSYLPTLTHKYRMGNRWNYRVVPIAQATPSTLSKYPGLTAAKWKSAWNHTHQIMSKKVNASSPSAH